MVPHVRRLLPSHMLRAGVKELRGRSDEREIYLQLTVVEGVRGKHNAKCWNDEGIHAPGRAGGGG